jgi:hypothetical protein
MTLAAPHPDHPIALESPATIAVIGAGPIGLEAALYGRFLGYEVTVFDSGPVAANVQDWQHLPLLTPFQDLHSRLGRYAITTQNPQHVFPDSASCITGQQWRQSYLVPLAETDLLAAALRTHHPVLAVSRCHYPKHHPANGSRRWQDGFQVTWSDPQGQQQSDTFDFVLDASGTFQHSQDWGPGGGPAVGQAALLTQTRENPAVASAVHWVPPDFAQQPARWERARILLIGDSLIAAHAALEWRRHVSTGQLCWALPHDIHSAKTFPVVPADPLPARDRLLTAANDLIAQHRAASLVQAMNMRQAASAAQLTQVLGCTSLNSIAWDADRQALQAQLLQWTEVDWEAAPDDFEEPDEEAITGEFDHVIIAVGHRVDETLTRALQVPRCPSTECTVGVLSDLQSWDEASGGDRFRLTLDDPVGQLTPEGRFFVLGTKSFGRQPNYFHRIGLQQVRNTFRWIVGRHNLDLEATIAVR